MDILQTIKAKTWLLGNNDTRRDDEDAPSSPMPSTIPRALMVKARLWVEEKQT